MIDSPRHFLRLPYAALFTTAAALVLCTMSGCISGRVGGSMEPDEVINELRQDNIALKEEVATLQKNIETRMLEIETLEQQVKGARPMAEVAPSRVVEIKFDRYSSAIDSDGDKRDDMIRLYIKPIDQEGRFTPASGKASVQAVVLRTDREPLPLAQLDVNPDMWNKAYRTGAWGTHFTLELPLTGTDSTALNTLKKGIHQITVMVTFTDAATGARVSHQAVYPVSR